LKRSRGSSHVVLIDFYNFDLPDVPVPMKIARIPRTCAPGAKAPHESAVLGEPRVGSSGESRPLPARNFVIA